MKFLFSVTMVFILVLNAEAAQRRTVQDGDTIKISISNFEINRLSIAGNGRLKKVWSPDGYLDLQPDLEQGEAYFLPSKRAPKNFSFFVRDDLGNTFTLVATQDNLPSQTILLTAQHSIEKNGSENFKSLPIKKAGNDLFKAMHNGISLKGYAVSDQKKDVPVWKETKITLARTYTSRKYVGNVYEVENISDKEIRFKEQEFFGFGDLVQAAGIEKLLLKPKETTRLFIFRLNGNGVSK